MANQQTNVEFEEPVLVFSCSGCADVGAVADQAARRLAREGVGKQFCLAGVGGRIQPIMERTATAKRLLAIEGCNLECVSNCLKQAGFTHYVQLRLADLGLEKGRTDISRENVTKVTEKAKALLGI